MAVGEINTIMFGWPAKRIQEINKLTSYFSIQSGIASNNNIRRESFFPTIKQGRRVSDFISYMENKQSAYETPCGKAFVRIIMASKLLTIFCNIKFDYCFFLFSPTKEENPHHFTALEWEETETKKSREYQRKINFTESVTAH